MVSFGAAGPGASRDGEHRSAVTAPSTSRSPAAYGVRSVWPTTRGSGALVSRAQGACAVDDDEDREAGFQLGGSVPGVDHLGGEELCRFGRQRGPDPATAQPPRAQPCEVLGPERRHGDTLEGDLWGQPQPGVVGIEPEPVVLEHDREVGGFLQLHDEDTLTDRVRLPRWDEDRIASLDLEPVEEGEQPFVLGLHQLRELRASTSSWKPTHTRAPGSAATTSQASVLPCAQSR